ncbi:unnamed protein product [Symbiodinium sp. CCMP2456]|nr:unnamed protein product [Symbiodinium sp. CCMP2456]
MLWFVVGCISIALNAVLIQQLISKGGGCDPWRNPEETGRPASSLASEIAELAAREITELGQLFFRQKVSELLMEKAVQEEMGFTSQDSKKEHPLVGLAVELLSVVIQPEEVVNERLNPSTVRRLKERLDEHGAVVIKGLHQPMECRSAAEFVHAEILSPWATFSNIRDNKYRKDYALPMRGSALELLNKTLGILDPLFTATLGLNSSLVEFSSLTTYSGAGPQIFHSDSSASSIKELRSLGRMFSAFIYLDDVRPDSAPLDVVPGTHTHYQFLDEEEKDLMTSVPFARLAVPQGTVVIYDSRTLHRGAANTSPYARPTIYFSLAERGKFIPIGPAYSLREGYRRFPISIQNVRTNTIPTEVLAEGVSVHSDEKCRDQLQHLCPAAGFQGDPDRRFDCAWYYFTGEEESQDARRLSKSQPLEFTDRPGVKEGYQDSDEDELAADREKLNDQEGNFDFEAALAMTLRRGGAYRSYPLDRRIMNCGVASRMEMILERGIFAEGFVANVSWGALRPLASRASRAA